MKGTASMKAIVFQFILLVSILRIGFGQSADRVGELEVTVINARGEAVSSDVELMIEMDDSAPTRHVVVRTGSKVTLPWGLYRVSGYAGRYGLAPERLVRVYQPNTQLVLVLRPRPMDDDDPWIIQGRIEPAPRPGEVIVARMVALYLNASAETIIDKDGNFKLLAWEISPYKLWILRNGKRIAELDVDVDFQPKVLPVLKIQIP